MLDELTQAHKTFTMNGGFGLLTNFLTTKEQKNDEIIRELCCQEFQLIGGKRSIARRLIDRKKFWVDKFKQKYQSAKHPEVKIPPHYKDEIGVDIQDPLKIRRAMLRKAWRKLNQQPRSLVQESTNVSTEGDDEFVYPSDDEVKHIKTKSNPTTLKAYEINMRSENLGLEFYEQKLQGSGPNMKSAIEKKLKDHLKQVQESKKDKSLADNRFDGIENKRLR